MKFFSLTALFLVFCFVLLCVPSVFSEGTIKPPDNAFDSQTGTPVSTMKSLNDVEPRTIITNLPIAITNSGSYYLVRPLQGTNGIFIDTDDVILDLGGFGIVGDTNIPTHGIEIGDDVLHVTIKNGKIGDWGGWAIYSVTNADFFELTDLTIELTMQGGIKLGPNCRLTRISMSEVNGDGLVLGAEATIADCKVNNCSQRGIIANSGSTITSCNATQNKLDGIRVDTYCTVRDCTVVGNEDDGIEGHASCRILQNNVGDSVNAGIHMTGPGNRIKDNNITADGRGIQVEGDSNWIENNNVIDNGVGIQITGIGNFVIRNGVGTPLNTNGQHFAISPGNQVGEVLGNLGTNFNNSNPWANIRLTEEHLP